MRVGKRVGSEDAVLRAVISFFRTGNLGRLLGALSFGGGIY